MKILLPFMISLALSSCGLNAREEALPVEGSVCGDVSLRGDQIGDVEGAGACGIENAVLLREVSGVQLSRPARVECSTALALKTWIEQGVQPTIGDEGGGVASLRVVADYACRNRNNRSNARLSEHGYGRAIDIAAIGLADGSEISVLTDWGNGRYGAQLREMWRAACGPFGTVLGPEADRYHQDHFHLDTADYRSGPYCR